MTILYQDIKAAEDGGRRAGVCALPSAPAGLPINSTPWHGNRASLLLPEGRTEAIRQKTVKYYRKSTPDKLPMLCEFCLWFFITLKGEYDQ
jgi:hypothetical protein